MSYYCNICDKTITIKSKNKQLESLTHKDYDEFIGINRTFQNPNFFKVDKIFTIISLITMNNLNYILLGLFLK